MSLRLQWRPRQRVHLHEHHDSPLPEAPRPPLRSCPLLDRIDIHVDVPRVEYEKLSDKRLGEPSSAIRARVEAARKRQRERFKGVEGVSYNGEMRPAEIRDYCELDAAGHLPLRSMSRWLRLIQARPCDNCT